ncbi:MAG: glutaredoxin family protein [Caldilineaceae bacterium]|nr:glutaredoxin family protein [Caldilineaceae bacterium]
MRVTLYTRPGCSLCDKLKADLLAFQAELNFDLLERNIEADADDFQRYRYLIPVLDIERGELLYPPHHPETVRDALRKAHRQTT